MFGHLPIPPLLEQFLLTVVFSFVIGLELHSYRRANQNQAGLGFGTTRTFTLIGILGFVLYVLDEHGLLYLGGLLVLAAFLALYYRQRVSLKHTSLLSLLLALMTYLIGPIAIRLPAWFLVLFVVTALLMLGEKPGIRRFSDAFRSSEIITLAKFLIMAGVVLPLLPDKQIAPFVSVTYYQVWLAVIVVSGLSYASYLAQTYFFPARGILLTGLLGGLYSSTAATVVLGRRARELPTSRLISPALILATTMMYLRLLVLVYVLGHHQEALRLLLPFVILMIASIIAAFLLYRSATHEDAGSQTPPPAKHPLEISAAFVFALLFVIFAGLTQVIVGRFGTAGLHVLSFAVGFTDIDPFVLSLLAGHFHVSAGELTAAILLASGSNNLLKAGYAAGLGRNRNVLPATVWLVLLFVASVIYVYGVL
ncbi:MAG: DUF4010 domain-containing protein [Gammaproteobacteria bacterium]|jgi:uncharacterized membrane protein (DUF4010 family)